MKPDDHPEIAAALRAAKPDPHAPADLETRILRALDHHRRLAPAPRALPLWPWLAMTAAAAAVIAAALTLATPPGPAAVPVTSAPPPTAPAAIPPPASPESAVPDSGDGALAVVSYNPLETETRAISRDAIRAARFLLENLPSLELRQQ